MRSLYVPNAHLGLLSWLFFAYIHSHISLHTSTDFPPYKDSSIQAAADKKTRPAPAQPLPLVERTNKLSLEEFTSNYVPTSLLEIEIRPRRKIGQEADESAQDDERKMEKYTLDIYTANSIPKSDFESCFSLVELTSSGDYANSGTGWSPTKKKREMKLPDMRYLILRPGSDDAAVRDEGETRLSDSAQRREEEVLGFLSFMVTYEDGKEVIYCYEIHLSPAVQGRGLGKQLIKRCEEIGRRVGLEKSMLSVFRSNTRALNMYTTSGYTVDEFSPPPRKLRNGTVKEAEYLIMSKVLKDSREDRERSDKGQ